MITKPKLTQIKFQLTYYDDDEIGTSDFLFSHLLRKAKISQNFIQKLLFNFDQLIKLIKAYKVRIV